MTLSRILVQPSLESVWPSPLSLVFAAQILRDLMRIEENNIKSILAQLRPERHSIRQIVKWTMRSG